jgi:ATP-binding cassette subfamily B protein
MDTLRRILGYTRPYARWMGAALVSMAGVLGLNMLIPWLTKCIIDEALLAGAHQRLGPLALAAVGVAVVRAGAAFVQRYSMEQAAQNVIYDLRSQLYEHLQTLSFAYYDRAQTGQLMSRVTGDVETLRRMIGFGILNLVSNAGTFVAVLVVLLWTHWRLTAVSLVVLPFFVYVAGQFAGKVRPAYRDIQAQLAAMTATLQENVTGMRVVRAFAQEDAENRKFHEVNWGYLEKELRAVRLWAFYFPLMGFLSALGTVFVVWYGGLEVMRGALTLGGLVAFNAYLMMLVVPLRMFGWIVNLYQRAIASGQRVFEILDTPAAVRDLPGAVEAPRFRGHVRFEDVRFAYPGTSQLVLDGVSVEARPGEVVAILGATGAGKSTLVNLVPRFYDPTGGRVTIDGRDVREFTLASLRRQIGMVQQETFLFSATISENIAYGRPGATAEEVELAARTARIHDFIVSLPDGYQTVVGERGIGLSGGQRQRVAIARALLMDPRILILDDATSSVDTETEYLIQVALSELMRSRTTFVIAQRLSTVKNADEVIVLERGRIVERGTHSELLLNGRRYQEIYELQFRDQEVAAP